MIITYENEPEITVDNIEVAQFIYLMLNNRKVRNVIDTITSKAVLILGRFTDERKAVLDALREELRKRNYVPILFDFDVASHAGHYGDRLTAGPHGTVHCGGHHGCQEHPAGTRRNRTQPAFVPVQPLLLEASAEYSMFEHFRRYPWVLETYTYPSSERLIADLGDKVIRPAEEKVLELRG